MSYKEGDGELGLFFQILEKIVNGPGSWQEKKDALKERAEELGYGTTALVEIANWFAND